MRTNATMMKKAPRPEMCAIAAQWILTVDFGGSVGDCVAVDSCDVCPCS